jgi:hypothetical protein
VAGRSFSYLSPDTKCEERREKNMYERDKGNRVSDVWKGDEENCSPLIFNFPSPQGIRIFA